MPRPFVEMVNLSLGADGRAGVLVEDRMSDEAFWVEDLAPLLPPISPDSIVSRTVYTGPGLRVTLFGFAEGQELTEHTASRPAVLHFLRGRASLTTGERAGRAGPGTWVSMPANMPHSVRAEEELVMLLLLFG